MVLNEITFLTETVTASKPNARKLAQRGPIAMAAPVWNALWPAPCRLEVKVLDKKNSKI